MWEKSINPSGAILGTWPFAWLFRFPVAISIPMIHPPHPLKEDKLPPRQRRRDAATPLLHPIPSWSESYSYPQFTMLMRVLRTHYNGTISNVHVTTAIMVKTKMIIHQQPKSRPRLLLYTDGDYVLGMWMMNGLPVVAVMYRKRTCNKQISISGGSVGRQPLEKLMTSSWVRHVGPLSGAENEKNMPDFFAFQHDLRRRSGNNNSNNL